MSTGMRLSLLSILAAAGLGAASHGPPPHGPFTHGSPTHSSATRSSATHSSVTLSSATLSSATHSSATPSSTTTPSLSDVCSIDYVRKSLPLNAIEGVTIDASSVAIGSTYNYTASGSDMYPNATFSFCNTTFSYSHDNTTGSVQVQFWIPAPSDFQKRYLSTGGGGLAINSGASSLAGGIPYGAVAGETDGGFGSFATQVDAVYLVSNGTVNETTLVNFGYNAHHELSLVGKAFTKNFFNMTANEKLYSYYQACSEGGREGWSQVQRYGGEFDGAVIGAPAFRYSFQQVNHLTSDVIEKTLNYFPPPCEFAQIVTETIKACDGLDGKTDGVVSRTDLCKMHFNMSSIIGTPYYCAATGGGVAKRQFGPAAAAPAQNGTITAEAIAVASQIIDGLHDNEGRQVYLSYQPSAPFSDAGTKYNSTTNSWGLSISGLGGEWVTRFLELQNTSTLATLDGVTYDTLKNWMIQGLHMYNDTLQVDNPDLTTFHNAGGKVLHFHGESDDSVPAASSVRYWEAVRKVMYPHLSANASAAALKDWYRLYLVPGGAHCSPSPLQGPAPFPQTQLAVMIDWVEKGVVPVTLNATVLSGVNEGQKGEICSWPLRPLWTGNGTIFECVYDQASIDNWQYDFNGVNETIY